MTFHRILLPGIAALLMTASASAQCYRSSSVVLRPSYRPWVAPQVTYRRHLINPLAPTLETAPDPAAIQFGACSSVDAFASRLEILMNEICLDLYYNYTHNIDFHATYTEAYTLYQMARSIHASVHNFDREAVCQQLDGADALFHHIEDDVCDWTRIHRRQVGTLGLRAKMDLAEEALHCLMKDVGVHVTPGLQEAPAPGSLPLPAAPVRLR